MFPFFFYGARPADVRDGAHLWLVRLAARPDSAAREALGRAIATAEARAATMLSSVLVADDGPWLLLEARTPESADADPGATFRDVAELLRAIGDDAGIEEVILTTALGLGRDAWDTWTRARRPLPSVTPLDFTMPGGTHVRRLDAPFYGAEYARACAEAPGPFGFHADASLSRGYQEARESRAAPVLELVAVDEPPSPFDPPPPALEGALSWLRSPSGRAVGFDDKERTVVVLDPASDTPRRFPAKAGFGSFAFSPDGTRFVEAVDSELRVVELDDFAERALPLPLPYSTPSFVDDTHLVLSATGTIALYRFARGVDASPFELHRRAGAYHVFTALLGKYLVSITEDDSTLYAVEGERILLVGTFRGFTDGSAFARDGALRIEDLGDDTVYAIAGC